MRLNVDLGDIAVVVFVLLWVIFIGCRILILLIRQWWENRKHKDDKDEKRN